MILLLDADIKIHKTKLLTETKFASKHAQPNNKKKSGAVMLKCTSPDYELWSNISIPPLINMRAPELATAIKSN